jgi:hypothetical protein
VTRSSLEMAAVLRVTDPRSAQGGIHGEE